MIGTTTARGTRRVALAALITVATALGLGACKPPPAAPLARSGWVLLPESLGVPVPGGVQITANFEAVTVSGSTGCNTYGAPFHTSGGTIIIGDIVATKIGCEPDIAAAEAEYLRKLAAVRHYRVIGQTLGLSDDAGNSLRFRAAAAPSAPGFVGNWTVTGVTGGATGAIVPIEASSLTLDIRADGQLSGRLCNTYAATWTADGASLTINHAQLVPPFNPCPSGSSELLNRYTAALGRVATWRVENGRLVLADPDGRDLVTADRR